MSLPETEAVRGPFTGLTATPGIYSVAYSDGDQLIIIWNDWTDDAHIQRFIVWGWVHLDEENRVNTMKSRPGSWLIHFITANDVFMNEPWFRIRSLGGS